MNKFNFLLAICVCSLAVHAVAQASIGGVVMNSDAAFQVTSTANNKGLLLPSAALSSTALSSPLAVNTAGMILYNTATAGTAPTNVRPGYYYNTGSGWINVSDVELESKSLVSDASPAGTTGKMLYNTNANSGLPVGPVFWNGTKWVNYNITPAKPTVSGAIMRNAGSSILSVVVNGNSAMRLIQSTAIPSGVTVSADSSVLTFTEGGNYYFSYEIGITIGVNTTVGISANGVIDEFSKASENAFISLLANFKGETFLTIPAGGTVSLVRQGTSVNVLSGSAKMTFLRMQ